MVRNDHTRESEYITNHIIRGKRVRIFISYRRTDNRALAERIYDRLINTFGQKNIFKDVDRIQAGDRFPVVIERALSEADILLVIIGQKWLNSADAQGNRRLENPNDFVSIEVQAGLRHSNIRVIPVLVDEADMPSAETLPPVLRDLALRHAITVRNDPDFHHDMDRLIKLITPRGVSRVWILSSLLILVSLIGFMLIRSGGNLTVSTVTPATNIAVLVSPTATMTGSVKPADTFTNTSVSATSILTDTARPLTNTSTPIASNTAQSTLTSIPTLPATFTAEPPKVLASSTLIAEVVATSTVYPDCPGDERTKQSPPTDTLSIATPNPTPGYIGLRGEQLANCGVLIVEIVPGSPAEKAKLKADDVVVALDGIATPTIGQLRDGIMAKHPGEKVLLTIQRSGKQLDVEVVLSDPPTPIP